MDRLRAHLQQAFGVQTFDADVIALGDRDRRRAGPRGDDPDPLKRQAGDIRQVQSSKDRRARRVGGGDHNRIAKSHPRQRDHTVVAAREAQDLSTSGRLQGVNEFRRRLDGRGVSALRNGDGADQGNKASEHSQVLIPTGLAAADVAWSR